MYISLYYNFGLKHCFLMRCLAEGVRETSGISRSVGKKLYLKLKCCGEGVSSQFSEEIRHITDNIHVNSSYKNMYQ